ncbi:MAG: DUF2334 domain-containing protein [Clostridiales bacterium]|nr:DUF2334 domain-containing protein [Clostridiales bacterium]
MKKITALFLAFVLSFMIFLTETILPVGAEEYLVYSEPAVVTDIQPSGLRISFPSGETRNTLFCNGRLCVSLADGVRLLGGEYIQLSAIYRITIDEKLLFLTYSTGNRPVIFIYNGLPYVSLYELITPFGYEMTVDLGSNFCSIVKYDTSVYITAPNSNGSPAYIRLEDIAADGLRPEGEGNYTVEMLEKLKYTAEYLYLSGQQYYIAWIPLYVYPERSYTNDISKDYNLYNSYFIYVLDYMTDHNGHLGLHGYSHQYGDDESGVGYEWGSDTPYSYTEQQERMIKAKEACHKLGYKDEFFEFPHYAATSEQLLMAENYFDAVYQSYPEYDKSDIITYTERSGKAVYYIPTPAGYVRYIRDDSIYANIEACIQNGYALSLYFHPVIDKGAISVDEYNGKRIWSFTEEAALPKILSQISENGYVFSSFN